MAKCAATSRNGKPCAKTAGWGTDHPGVGNCRHHGGATPNGRKAAKKEQARQAVAVYGLPREIDPHAALLEELHRTAGHVAWLGSLIGNGVLEADLSPSGRKRAVKLTQDVFGGGEQASVWVELYQRERSHLAAVAKTCISVGIEERRVQLAEQHGALIAQAIRGILTDLGVMDHPEVPTVVRRHLALVAGTG